MPKCSLSYAKIEQIESRKAKLAWAVMPKCSLSYAKIEQIESRKAKLAWAVMPRCSLSYAKIHIIYTLRKLSCEKLNFDLATDKGL